MPVVKGKGWFAIPGVQHGDRTLDEQMRGLQCALAEADGASIADLGCAEGLIAFEFLKAGAAWVYGCDYNRNLVEVAQDQQQRATRGHLAQFVHADLRKMRLGRTFDIVLALAIIHKMDEPAELCAEIARICTRLAVIRLPKGSTGNIAAKFTGVQCDINAHMSAGGFSLERVERGPRTELVQYWRKR